MKKIIAVALFLLSISAVAGEFKADTIRATGTAHFIFDVASEATIDGLLFARFVPDANSMERFPVVTTGKYPAAIDYIALVPAQEALEALLGEAEAERVAHGHRPREIEFAVQVELSDFGSEIECDSRYYYATVVEMKHLADPDFASNDVPDGC